MRSRPARRRTAAALIAIALLAAACNDDDDGGTTGTTAGGSTASTTADDLQPGDDGFYVSLGDSYAAGFQVNAGSTVATATTNGYADQVIDLAADAGLDYTLVNLGCGGATTESMLTATGCTRPPVGGSRYLDVSQVESATTFMRDHEGEIGLVTVMIGGNDFFGCVTDSQPQECYETALESIGTNLDDILGQVRDAVGADVPVIGLTYPNILLGPWITSANRPAVAEAGAVFESTFNPALRSHYEGAGAQFVDVTEATGGYGSLDETTVVEPYGEIPEPVARVCELTFFCELSDPHGTTEGYRVIAQLVVDAIGG